MEENNDMIHKWFQIFQKGWNVRVIENEHLMKICFLEMLSTVNKVRYVYGGQYKNVNLSSFKIQQSGTGKGVGDGYVHDLLRYMGYKVCKLNSFTEAAAIGTVKTDYKGNTQIIKGALGEYDFIWIDEARNLIVGNAWTNGLLETINGFMDNGEIHKMLAKGAIKYKSDCVFGTGSFFFQKLKLSVLQTGLFQRCLLTYKPYKSEDIYRISKKFDKLASKDYLTDLKPIFEQMKFFKDNLNFEKYNISKDNNYKNYVIKMTEEASINFGEIIDDYFRKNIADKLHEEILRSILHTFLIRSKEIGHKLMCLHAVWNQKDVIDENDVDFAVPFIKEQLQNVLEFISDVFESKTFDEEEISNESIKRKKIKKTEFVILETINKYPGISKTEFREYLQKK